MGNFCLYSKKDEDFIRNTQVKNISLIDKSGQSDSSSWYLEKSMLNTQCLDNYKMMVQKSKEEQQIFENCIKQSKTSCEISQKVEYTRGDLTLHIDELFEDFGDYDPRSLKAFVPAEWDNDYYLKDHEAIVELCLKIKKSSYEQKMFQFTVSFLECELENIQKIVYLVNKTSMIYAFNFIFDQESIKPFWGKLIKGMMNQRKLYYLGLTFLSKYHPLITITSISRYKFSLQRDSAAKEITLQQTGNQQIKAEIWQVKFFDFSHLLVQTNIFETGFLTRLNGSLLNRYNLEILSLELVPNNLQSTEDHIEIIVNNYKKSVQKIKQMNKFIKKLIIVDHIHKKEKKHFLKNL